MKDVHKFVGIAHGIEARQRLQGPLSEAAILGVVAQALHDRVREMAREWTATTGESPVDAIRQPFRDAANVERRDRYRMAAGFETDETERLRPDTGHDQQVERLPQRLALLAVDPADEFDGHPVDLRLHLLRLLLPGVTGRSVAGERDANRPAQRRPDRGQRRQQEIATLQRHQATEKQQPVLPRRPGDVLRLRRNLVQMGTRWWKRGD